MLTRRHGIAAYDLDTRLVIPDRLVRGTHAAYLDRARQVMDVYLSGKGRTQIELHREVQQILMLDPLCPPRRAEAFCKLLDDQSTYHRIGSGPAAELRREVFSLATMNHPLVETPDLLCRHSERQTKEAIARALGQDWTVLEKKLFADYPDFRSLAEFQGYPNAESLLSRYNVAQVQVVLYDAVHLTIWARNDFKTIIRYAKLARLMHTIEPLYGGGFCIRLDGPASVLRRTTRYGSSLARFLPALVACRDWQMHAVIRVRKFSRDLALNLSSDQGYRSHFPRLQEFDSRVEEQFAADWGEERDGWRISRETEILSLGQKAFLPDFVLQHRDGRRVLLEIVGFWTISYLEAKLRTLRCFSGEPILLAVAESAACTAPAFAEGAVLFRRRININDVLSQLQRIPACPSRR